MIDMDRMEGQLILHEGLNTTPYYDTLGNLTVGVGYNLTARGWDAFNLVIGRTVVPGPNCVTREECLKVLGEDILRTVKVITVHFPPYAALDNVRQRVIIDLAFNLGLKVYNFVNCLADIKARDWSGAARELYKSKWAYQVGDGPGGKFDRADRLAGMLLTGTDYTK